MRLKKHLTESDDSKIVSDMIKKDCQPWLKEIGKNSGFLWRFISRTMTSDIDRIQTRRDRQPRDTSKEMHVITDNLFKKYWGIRARSRSVFCWNANTSFNLKHMVFPIGKYKYVYPKTREHADLFNWLARLFDLTDAEQMEQIKTGEAKGHKISVPWQSWPKGEWHKHMTPMRQKSIEIAIKNGYTNKNIKSILNKSSEIREVMMVCDEYYMVNTAFETSLQQELWR